MQEAYSKLDKLVKLNADGLMVLDQEGRILFLNPAATEMLGREQNDLLEEQFGQILIPGLNTEIELLSNSGETSVVELRSRETEWNGQTALLVSFRDITERKRAEEKIYNLALVQTIIAMGHNMGKEVLAEGVEREEQRQKLCELGCDYGQGFLWSRPQPVENLTLTGD